MGLYTWIKANQLSDITGLDKEQYTVKAKKPIKGKEAKVSLVFKYDGKPQEYGKGGTATIYVDGQKVATGPVGRTVPFVFSGLMNLPLLVKINFRRLHLMSFLIKMIPSLQVLYEVIVNTGPDAVFAHIN